MSKFSDLESGKSLNKYGLPEANPRSQIPEPVPSWLDRQDSPAYFNFLLGELLQTKRGLERTLARANGIGMRREPPKVLQEQQDVPEESQAESSEMPLTERKRRRLKEVSKRQVLHRMELIESQISTDMSNSEERYTGLSIWVLINDVGREHNLVLAEDGLGTNKWLVYKNGELVSEEYLLDLMNYDHLDRGVIEVNYPVYRKDKFYPMKLRAGRRIIPGKARKISSVEAFVFNGPSIVVARLTPNEWQEGKIHNKDLRLLNLLTKEAAFCVLPDYSE